MNHFDVSLGFTAGMIIVLVISCLLPKPKEKGEIYKFKCVECDITGKYVLSEKVDGDVLYCPNGHVIKLVPPEQGRMRVKLDKLSKKGGKVL